MLVISEAWVGEVDFSSALKNRQHSGREEGF